MAKISRQDPYFLEGKFAGSIYTKGLKAKENGLVEREKNQTLQHLGLTVMKTKNIEDDNQGNVESFKKRLFQKIKKSKKKSS
jgi:hypothetical protein